MKVISSPYLARICSATSVTGPQTRDSHSCGVANSSATGFLPTTSAKLSCMSLAGSRVSSIALVALDGLERVRVGTRRGFADVGDLVRLPW